MKKVKLIIAAVAMMGLVSGSIASADGFAPGEGLYIGGFVGAGTGMVQPKVETTAQTTTVGTAGLGGNRKGGIFEAEDGGLGLEGIEGGGVIGYGYKMGDLYAGLEGEMAGGDVEFKLTSNTAVTGVGLNKDGESGITEVSATKDWTGGMFGRVGYYVNQDTLFSVRGGVLVSKFDVAFGDTTEEFYGGGPAFGADLTSRITAVDPGLSVRMGLVYTDFLTSPISGIGDGSMNNVQGGGSQSHDSEITGSALSARVGLQYSFFDINSLF